MKRFKYYHYTGLIISFLAFGILIGAFVTLVASYSNSQQAKTSPISLKNFAGISQNGERIDVIQERKRWSDRIDEVGVERAYEELKKTHGSQQYQTRRYLANIFGELLYEKSGLGQTIVCDDPDYGWSVGCYHGFGIAAVSEKGLEMLPILNHICKGKPKSVLVTCQKGIGQGLIRYFGRDKLLEALRACELVVTAHPFFNCSRGVFIEYNAPTGIGGLYSLPEKARVFNVQDPYAPCPAVPKNYRLSCYFSLPRWWFIVLSDYKAYGAFCVRIVDSEERDACFQGIGSAAVPISGYNIEKTIKVCQAVSNIKGEVLCRIAAAEVLAIKPEYRKLIPILCDGIGTEAERECLSGGGIIDP